MNTEKDKLIAEFIEALSAAGNASFDCGEYKIDNRIGCSGCSTNDYAKLVKASLKAKAKVVKMFKSALETRLK